MPRSVPSNWPDLTDEELLNLRLSQCPLKLEGTVVESRIELGSIRAGDTEVDVDAVVHTLQDTIRCVREVQDEFRRLGH